MLNFFYQINEDDEIRTRDHLVIKALIPCQRTISIQKLKLLSKIPENNLYYSLTLQSLIFQTSPIQDKHMTIGMQDFLPPVQSLPLGWKIGVKEANEGKVSYKHQWIMMAQLTRLVQVRTTVLEPKQANTTTTTTADECHSLIGRKEAGSA